MLSKLKIDFLIFYYKIKLAKSRIFYGLEYLEIESKLYDLSIQLKIDKLIYKNPSNYNLLKDYIDVNFFSHIPEFAKEISNDKSEVKTNAPKTIKDKVTKTKQKSKEIKKATKASNDSKNNLKKLKPVVEKVQPIIKKQKSLSDLKKELEKALLSEDYLEAAKLRDLINKVDNKKTDTES